MTTNDKSGAKGFAGLDDMVSEIDIPSTPAVPLRPAARATQSSAEPRPSVPIRPFEVEEPYVPPQKSGSSSGWIWAIGIGVIVLIGVGLNSGNSSSKVAYTPPPAPTYTPTYQPPPPAPVYEPPVELPTPTMQAYESQPLPGTDNVLNESELRYCMSQKIRIQGWEPNVDTSSQTSVDAFNFAVQDFNMGCSSYRYRTAEFERVRSEVDSRSTDLRFEGVNLATQNP